MSDLSTNDSSTNEPSAQNAENDSAWASVITPLSVEALMEFCADTERLFRINPMLVFTKWEQTSENSFDFSGENSSQDKAFEFEFGLTVSKLDDGYRIDYDKGVKSSTVLKIEAAEKGSKLTITDHYDRLPASERESQLHEVDQSIVIWAEYLQKFCISWNSWSKFALWRWYMRRIWQPMKPTARRITYMLLWITVVEIALLALGAGVYYNEFVLI
jgi:hypothetical protein